MLLVKLLTISLSTLVCVTGFHFQRTQRLNSNLCMNSNEHQLSFQKLPLLLGSLLILAEPLAARAEFKQSSWNSGVQYEVVKSNPTGDMAKVGELAAIRFKGSYKGTEFDNTFATSEPYYYRAGVGGILKGLDETIMNMHVGEVYKLKFGGDLAFGEKGKPSAPGKPRIPPNAEIEYEVEFTELPGNKEDFIADYE